MLLSPPGKATTIISKMRGARSPSQPVSFGAYVGCVLGTCSVGIGACGISKQEDVLVVLGKKMEPQCTRAVQAIPWMVAVVDDRCIAGCR